VVTVKNLMVRRWPWWLVGLLGLACVIVGAVLIAAPFTSLKVLVWWVAAGLVVTGVAQLLAAPPWWSRVVGSGWILVGVAAPFLPGLTLRALALIVGLALVVGGLIKIISSAFGYRDERLVSVLMGLTGVIVGGLSIGWQAITILVLAIVFGIRTVLFGYGQIARALSMRRGGAEDGQAAARRTRPRWLRVTGSAAALLLAVAGMGLSIKVHRAIPGPTAFYTAPTTLPDGHGTIIRSEVIDGFQPQATTYRVLYTSTGYDGTPTAVSGLVVVPDGPPPAGGRKIVAFAHGTVGVAINCAPSLLASAAAAPVFEGLDLFLAAGYAVAATDYQGLGTPGPHPYLVGAVEARNTLDIVRAAHRLPEAHAGTTFAVTGHSQGGHAALFTGQTAAAYAPDLRLVGVAAGAPVPDLVDLFPVNMNTTVGKVLIAMALKSWSGVYHDAELAQIVTPAARPSIDKIAGFCLFKQQILATVPSALLLGLTFITNPPWTTEPWKTIAETNTPGGARTGVPILITQGEADPIVAPAATAKLASKLCAGGEQVHLRTYPGVAHLDAGFHAAPDIATWIADRFAGTPASTTCA
jgi:uncharacterized membrane protein HdeD (DUF308 family)/pimeloyl-ACP methyl ester carboxylesterase